MSELSEKLNGDVAKGLVPNRNELLIATVKEAIKLWINNFSHTHIEIPLETSEMMKDKSTTILYVATHKSLWETVGIPYAINNAGGKIPYIVMGSNLVKGEIPKYFMRKLGVVYVDRESGNRLTPAVDLENKIRFLLTHQNNVEVFPEGTRTKDGIPKQFKNAAFEAAINASKENPVHIVPVNVDYSDINFHGERIISKINAPYTFKLHHVVHMLRHQEDVYITFGNPIKVSPEHDRKDLATYSREQCIQLNKILPINVFAESMMRILNNGRPHNLQYGREYNLVDAINEVMIELAPHQQRFRGFNKNTEPGKLIELADLPIDKDAEEIYKIYSGYISQFLSSKKEYTTRAANN